MAEDIKLRTGLQNRAMHLWFRDVADACLAQGVTINAILNQPAELQVDEGFIKWLFRRVGKKKYGKKSTAKLEVQEIDLIYDEMVKFFATKVEPPIELPPFPDKNMAITSEDYKEIIYGKTQNTIR